MPAPQVAKKAKRAKYMREYRARRKAIGGGPLRVPAEPPEPEGELAAPKPPRDPASAVAAWAEKRLRVPAGHENAGQPMALPEYFVEFLRDALAPGVREAGCFVARKNAKSACVAVLILAFLCNDGPLRRLGWRCGVASISKEKAGELWQQIVDIRQASHLAEVEYYKVPRRVLSRWGAVDFLSADKTAGHASGFDLAICDELGLFPEKGGRQLVAGMISSTSARDGRLLAISVLGDSALASEMVKRGTDPATVVYVHQAPAGCMLEDEAAWHQANPTLGTIKSISYMRDMARRASANPSEASAFRVYDLNQPGQGELETIVTVDAWQRCARHERPERSGPCKVAIDVGGAASMTAAAIFWPATRRLEVYGGYGDTPSLAIRGEADGVAERYVRMQEAGELRTWPGRVTPVHEFLLWLVELLEGEHVEQLLADRYRQAEVQDALQEAAIYWPTEWRGQGAGVHGIEDVRHFQRSVISEDLRPGESLILEHAIYESVLRYDQNGNAALDKRRTRSRIDPLSAAILAVGAGMRVPTQTTELHVAPLPS